MKKYLLAAITLLIASVHTYADDYEYPASDISSELKENAFAVVRDYSCTFTQSDKNNGTFKVKTVITILEKQGNPYSDFHFSGDKFRSLNNFSGIIRNAFGKVIKKIKKSDLTTSTLSDESVLASDHFNIFYECQSPSYPYTVEYVYDEKWKNGMISYPSFSPAGAYFVSVEAASMRIELPVDIKLRHRANYDCNLKLVGSGASNIYDIELKNYKAVKSEVWSPSYRETMPMVFMAPADFCYDSFCGNMDNWKNYGLWISELNKDRDILPEEFVNKLKALTANAQDNREKTRILYEYLQTNTRYVNIMMGIGGYQPFPAQSVFKSGFGDCKGLSNYMKAMLKAVDIPSNYCAISTVYEGLYPDYPNFNQMDHAILLVPLGNDSVWLECTNPFLPFGYVHEDISGHDALVIDENGKGGIVCKLPVYDNIPTSSTKLSVSVSEDGNVEGFIAFNEWLGAYESAYMKFRSNDRKKHVDYINSYLKIPNVQIGEISTNENRSAIPSAHLDARFTGNDFVNKTGNRMFLPVCPINKGSYSMFSAAERVHDIEIDASFFESDTIIVRIPDQYTTESLPKDIDRETPFGLLRTRIKHEGSEIMYIQDINIFKGKYDKSAYPEIKAFFAEINSAIKRKLVLKKI